MDEQLNVLFITETWQSCQGDEAQCVDMTPPDTSCGRSIIQPQVGVGFRCEINRL